LIFVLGAAAVAAAADAGCCRSPSQPPFALPASVTFADAFATLPMLVH